MNNPNPFVPKGSLLEQQSQRRSRLKLAVFCVLAVTVTGLVAMLIQGCKREKPSDESESAAVAGHQPARDGHESVALLCLQSAGGGAAAGDQSAG